jgi:hypothetical protein
MYFLIIKREYIPDLLSKIDMLDFKLANTSRVQNLDLEEYTDQIPTNKQRYQWLVRKLIYLSL